MCKNKYVNSDVNSYNQLLAYDASKVVSICIKYQGGGGAGGNNNDINIPIRQIQTKYKRKMLTKFEIKLFV